MARNFLAIMMRSAFGGLCNCLYEDKGRGTTLCGNKRITECVEAAAQTPADICKHCIREDEKEGST
jgi:hypothetical protein